MSKQEWLSEITPLIMQTATIAPLAPTHPAYRAACARVDTLIEQGLQRGFITAREAVTL